MRGSVYGIGGAEALDDIEDELFDLLGLDFGFGEELGGAKAELGAFGLGDLTAGVDDEGEGAEGGLVAEPVDKGEAVAVGQGEIEDEEVGRSEEAVVDGGLAGAGVEDLHISLLEAGDDDGGEGLRRLPRGGCGRGLHRMEDAGKLGEEEVLVEGLLHPALSGSGGGVSGGSAGNG